MLSRGILKFDTRGKIENPEWGKSIQQVADTYVEAIWQKRVEKLSLIFRCNATFFIYAEIFVIESKILRKFQKKCCIFCPQCFCPVGEGVVCLDVQYVKKSINLVPIPRYLPVPSVSPRSCSCLSSYLLPQLIDLDKLVLNFECTYAGMEQCFSNSLIIHEENSKEINI